MPDLDELYPGRFLKGRTLDQWMTIRILGVGGEPLEGDEGDAKLKGILKYRSAAGPGEIVLCKTNALLIAAVLGSRDYATWANHTVTIGFDPNVMMAGEKVGGIRVVGSPEIKAPLRVEVRRPRRRKAEVYTLQPTDGQGRVRGQQPQQPAPNRAGQEG